MSVVGLPTPMTTPVAHSEPLGRISRDAQPPLKTPARLVCPFRLGLDHMERLVVVGLKGDPEFTAIEPQVFDDPQNGRGMRILRYRRDGRVDVYHEPGVRLNRDQYTFGEGIADLCATPMSPAQFEIGPDGLRLDIAFTDTDGRRNALRIVEGGPSRGFPMLAPVGADIGKPRMLFLVLMRSIALLRRRGTVFAAQIGDRTLRPAALPLPLYGAWVWFTRHSDQLVIATLNPPATAPVVETLAQATEPGSGDRIVVDRSGDIVRLVAGMPGQGAEMGFAPAFPNLETMQSGQKAEGRWSLSICDSEITGGDWSALREGASVNVHLRPTVPWRPGRLPLAMLGMVRIVPRFRTWPTTYSWSGWVDLDPEPTMRGGWSRNAGE